MRPRRPGPDTAARGPPKGQGESPATAQPACAEPRARPLCRAKTASGQSLQQAALVVVGGRSGPLDGLHVEKYGETRIDGSPHRPGVPLVGQKARAVLARVGVAIRDVPIDARRTDRKHVRMEPCLLRGRGSGVVDAPRPEVRLIVGGAERGVNASSVISDGNARGIDVGGDHRAGYDREVEVDVQDARDARAHTEFAIRDQRENVYRRWIGERTEPKP